MTDPVDSMIDPTGFPCGAIISIQLIHFMVYDEAVFLMHPKLNMVIGPNGTGKSTIVCAMVVGLGASPKITGRGNDLYDYVQNGHNKAVTKITLSMGQNERPITILRILNKTNRTNEFFINKKKTTAAQVDALLNQLHIQVDNICQFLPQEKVSSLAAMDCIQLLREVQLAAGTDGMVEQHAQLIQLDQVISGFQSEGELLEERICTLTAKNESIRSQYQNFQARLDLMKQLSFNQILLSCVEYEKAKEDFKKVNQEKRQLDQQLHALQRQLEPMERSFAGARAHIEKTKERARTFSDKQERYVRRLHETQSNWLRCDRDLERAQEDLVRWRRSLGQSEQCIVESQRECEEMQARLAAENTPDLAPLRALETALRETQKRLSHAAFHCTRLEEQKRMNVDKMKQLHGEKQGAQTMLAKLQDQEAQVLAVLRQSEVGRAGVDAYLWIKQNRPRFRSEVRGPLLLSIKVPHPPHFAVYVESAIGRPVLCNSFLVDNNEDYEILVQQFNENPNRAERKRVSIFLHLKEALAPALSLSLLRPLGFEGVISDLIVTDEFTKNWLLHRANLHKMPYAKNEVDDSRVEAEESIQVYYANGTSFRLKRDRGDVVNTSLLLDLRYSLFNTRHLQQTQALQEFEQKIEQCQQQLDIIMTDSRSLTVNLEQAQLERRDVEREKADLTEKTKKLQEAKREREESERTLSEQRRDIAERQEKVKELKRKIEESASLTQSHLRRKLVYVDQLQPNLAEIKTLYKEKHILLLQVAVLEHQLREEMSQHLVHREEIKRLEQRVATVESLVTEVRDLATEIRSRYHSAIADLDIENKDNVGTLIDEEKGKLRISEKPLVEQLHFLQRRGEDMQAQLNAMPQGDLQILETYEERLEEIRIYQHRLEELGSTKSERLRERTALAETWVQALESLIQEVSQSFSDYFKEIGCAGEVLLHKPAFFKEYALHIRVKFRAGQEFHVLDKARQSGGERAVTTILFLLSLQKFSKAPFRLVDEINQGMDERNERLVHRLLVETSSMPNAPQYFLITPKLLCDLHYSRNMKVHPIMNGPLVLPELLDHEKTFFSTSHYIRKRQRDP